MRCLIHDFAGHPFQVQLSREMAARGHYVTHASPTGLPGPKGRLEKSAEDSDRLKLEAICLSATFKKYSPMRRFISQRKYASDLKALIRDRKPHVVLSGNTPIDVQAELLWYCARSRIAFVHWVQDVYSHALEFFLKRHLGSLAKSFSYPFLQLEKTVVNRSDSTIVISPSFKSLLAGWGVPEKKITTIENWAPLDELPPHPRRNKWAIEMGLEHSTVFLYSGTLGLKHRPDLLYRLAESLPAGCKMVVISEGVGRDYLAKLPPRDNLVLLNFQPYSRLPEVLATADVLIATLEADAGQFAVPSKVLSYLCAGRALLLAAPKINLAASVVERSGGGIVVAPEDTQGWVTAAAMLAENRGLREEMAHNARRYAERTFDIKAIATAFEQVLFAACKHPGLTPLAQTATFSS